jgi:transposase-like protein
MSLRKFSKDFKVAAVRQLEQGKSAAEVARACEVDPSMLYRWHKAWQKDPENAFRSDRQVSQESREAELERTVGRLTLENDFLKRALLKLEVQRAQRSGSGGKASTGVSRKK